MRAQMPSSNRKCVLSVVKILDSPLLMTSHQSQQNIPFPHSHSYLRSVSAGTPFYSPFGKYIRPNHLIHRPRKTRVYLSFFRSITRSFHTTYLTHFLLILTKFIIWYYLTLVTEVPEVLDKYQSSHLPIRCQHGKP